MSKTPEEIALKRVNDRYFSYIHQRASGEWQVVIMTKYTNLTASTMVYLDTVPDEECAEMKARQYLRRQYERYLAQERDDVLEQTTRKVVKFSLDML